jgi:GT2 family glycosyltransferase
MRISIIIVSWNVRALLEKCLASLERYTNREECQVIVVDNASTDESVAMVQEKFPWVEVIVNTENAGFARANNQALVRVTGEYVLLLNPDTEISSDTIEKCVQFMQTHPDAGAVGCKLLNADGSHQPSVRRFPTVLAMLFVLLKINKIWPNNSVVQSYLARDFDYSRTQSVGQIMGAFMFLPKKLIDQIGLFDERFFIWFEEVDLCRRIWQSGRKVYYTPDTTIIHHGGESFGQQQTLIKQWRFFKSAAQYYFKWLLQS